MKRKIHYIIAVMILCAGLVQILYPVVSSWYMGHHQAQVIAEYDDEAVRLSKLQIEEELKKAYEYNQKLLDSKVFTDPFRAEALNQKNLEYDNLLNIRGDSMMGSVEIPVIGVYLPVYHGSNDIVLEKGAGHLQNTSLPVGGEGTHAVILGHTALPSAKMFDRLSELKVGDIFYIHVLGLTLMYEIDQIKTVLPQETDELMIDRARDYVTLVTCTPYGINSHRLLVRGKRTD